MVEMEKKMEKISTPHLVAQSIIYFLCLSLSKLHTSFILTNGEDLYSFKILKYINYFFTTIRLDYPQHSTPNRVLKWVSCVYIINFRVILNKQRFSLTQHLKRNYFK